MPEQKVGIVAECICDLPGSYLKEHDIGVVYFTVTTDRGVFDDTAEVTAENIIGYMEAGSTVPVSSPPSAEVYEKIFREYLEKYGKVIFISTGSGASESFGTASEAAANMAEDGRNVHVFDSKHLSTGLGHIIIKAAEMAEEGYSDEEILAELGSYKDRVSTTFITVNADYLCRNGRVPVSVKKLCDVFGIHPVLVLKNGEITLKAVMFGNYEKASLRYVRRELKHADSIDSKRIFITHVGCSKKNIDRIKSEINRSCRAEKLIVTRASATISANCGPGTFGVLFVRKEKHT